MLYERENTKTTRLKPVVTLEVSREVAKEQDIILDGRVIVKNTFKKEEPEDRESDNRSVSSGDSTDDEKDDFIEVCTRVGREVKPVLINNPTDGKSYVNIAAVHNFYACLELLDNDKIELNTCTMNKNTEFANVGAGIGGGFGTTHKL
jgi:hypothetical protein